MTITQKRTADKIYFTISSTPVACLYDGDNYFTFYDETKSIDSVLELFGVDVSTLSKPTSRDAFAKAGLDVTTARLVDAMPVCDCDSIGE